MARTPQAKPTKVLELAKQGDPNAIAALINRSLRTKGVTATARLEGSCLHVILEADPAPDQQILAPFIRQGLLRLKAEAIQTIKLSGQLTHAPAPVWRQEIDLTTPAPKISSQSFEPTVINGNGKKGTPITRTTPVASGVPGSIEAHIQAAEISGQVAIGNYILQIGSISGGVVNFAPAESRPSMRPLPTPVFLQPKPFPTLLDRKAELGSIISALQAAQPVECFSQPGFGKTSLLRYSAHHPQITSPFPDGVVYLSARRQPAIDLLHSLFEAFHEADPSFKPTETQIRRALQGKKALILMDDVELAREDVEWLLDAAPTCTFLLTSQKRHLWGDDSAVVSLLGLPLADAISLVERSLKRSLTAAERPEAEALCKTLKGHPLRILQAIAVAQKKRLTLANVVNQLQAAASADTFTTQTAASFPEPEKRLLAALVVLGGAPVHAKHLTRITNLPDAEPVLQTLLEFSLVETDGLRYRLAETLIEPFQPVLDLAAWVPQTVNYFTTWAEQHWRIPDQILEDSEALLQMLELAFKTERWTDVLHLGQLMDAALTLDRRWGAWERVLQWELQAAQAIEEPAAEAWAMHQLGTQALCLDDPLIAHTYLTQALEIRETLGDSIGAAVSRHNLNILLGVPSPPQTDSSVSQQPPMAEPMIRSLLTRIVLVTLPLALGGAGIWYFWMRSAQVSFNPSNFDFAATEVGATSQAQTIIVTNPGWKALEISNVSLAGNHPDEFVIVADDCSEVTPLSAEDDCTVTVHFQPTAAGNRNAHLVVTYDADRKSQRASLQGVGTVPEVSLAPRRLEFRQQEIQTSSDPVEVSLTNSGAAPLKIEEITAIGDHPDDFTIVRDDCSEAPFIAPGNRCSVAIRFTPQAAGARIAELAISSNLLGDSPPLPLSGTGTVAPRLSISAPTLNFAEQEENTSSDKKTVTLTSSGTAAVTLESIAVIGVNRDDFSLTEDCPEEAIAPKRSCTITVSFRPTATGPRRAELAIRSNARNELQTPQLQGTGTAAELNLETTRLSFGSQEVGTTSEVRPIRLTNRGTAPLRIEDIVLMGGQRDDGDFSLTEDCSEKAIGPRDSCTLRVGFQPTATGARSAEITIDSNALNSPQRVQLQGTGTAAELTLDASTLSFAPQEVGTRSQVQTVTLVNSGTAPLRLEDIAFASGDEEDFEASGCSGAVIAPDDSCPLSIRFTPTATGRRSAVLTLQSNALNGSQRIQMRGDGIAAEIDIRPGSLSLGRQRLGTRSEAKPLILTNTGTAPLKIGDINREGDHPNDFTVSGCSNSTVEPGKNCSITVHFQPSTEGDRTAQLIIPSNAQNGLQRIPLQGVGIVAKITVEPSRLSFDVHRVGARSQPQSVTVTNSGSAPLTIGNISLTGPQAGDFIVRDCSNVNLDPGRSCRINVYFTPSAEGDRTAWLTIPSDAQNGEQRVPLQGTGAFPKPPNITPSRLSFGDQAIGTISQAQDITLTNRGEVPLTVGAISLSGDTKEFTVSGCSNTTLDPGRRCNMTVQFIPLNGGRRTAQLSVPNNSPDGSVSVSLSGMGLFPHHLELSRYHCLISISLLFLVNLSCRLTLRV